MLIIQGLGQTPTAAMDPTSFEYKDKMNPKAENLPEAITIANLVRQALKTGLYSASQAAAVADGWIRPDQRFYDIELVGAAQRLGIEAGTKATGAGWYIALRNNFGARVVEYKFCSYGFVVDPVTRECVKEAEKPAEYKEPAPEEPWKPPEEEKKTNWLLYAGIGLAILLLMKKS